MFHVSLYTTATGAGPILKFHTVGGDSSGGAIFPFFPPNWEYHIQNGGKFQMANMKPKKDESRRVDLYNVWH